MKIIANKNCTGKTKALIKESLETGNPILAMTPMKANSLREKSQAYFGEDVSIVDFLEAQNYDGKILIDDIDEILPQITRLAFKNDNLDIDGMVVNI